MPQRSLREFVESNMGDREVEFIIPHPFLPPRYQKPSQARNLVVLLDRDFTIHLRWEGSGMGPWKNITKGEFRRLAKTVLERVSRYRAEFKVFTNIMEKVAERPFSDPIYDEPLAFIPSRKGAASQEEKADGCVVAAAIKRNPSTLEVGGEPPLPETEW